MVKLPERRNMKYRYFINGFTYGRSYFFSVGSFTEEQKQMLYDGQVVKYNGNEFWIEGEEE